jgi:hypothetical protein
VYKSKLLLVFLLEAEVEGVILLEFCYFLKALSFDELSHGSAVCEFHEVAFEVIIGEAEVEILLWVIVHLFQFEIDHLSEVLVEGDIDGGCVRVQHIVVLQLAVLFLLEKSYG